MTPINQNRILQISSGSEIGKTFTYDCNSFAGLKREELNLQFQELGLKFVEQKSDNEKVFRENQEWQTLRSRPRINYGQEAAEGQKRMEADHLEQRNSVNSESIT